MAAQKSFTYGVAVEGGKFLLQRDGASMRTPAGHAFAVPGAELAYSIVFEWRAQKDKIVPSSMPMTQFAATTIDIVAPGRDDTVELLAHYADTDLLCFYTEEPEPLRDRQTKTWQPVLDWAAQHYGARLETGRGITPLRQDPNALQALRRAVEQLDAFSLTGVKHAAEITASLILALALYENRMTAAEVFDASEVDATFQAEKWGRDPATENRHEAIAAEIASCARWFDLIRMP